MRTFHLSSRVSYQLIGRSGKRDWYVTDRGRVIAIPSGLREKERGAAMRRAPFCRPKARKTKEKPGRVMVVRVGSKRYVLKRLVLRSFVGIDVGETWRIQHRDGNPENCALNNLILYSREEAERLGLGSRWKIEVEFNDGRTVIYRSLAECSKALYCDRSTLYDYLHGRVKDSCVASKARSVKKITEDGQNGGSND